jgi:hypothetical protein
MLSVGPNVLTNNPEQLREPMTSPCQWQQRTQNSFQTEGLYADLESLKAELELASPFPAALNPLSPGESTSQQ